jgi:hypothetical protein
MKWLKRTGKKIAESSANVMVHISKHPMEMIEMLLAFFLLLFGLYVMVPQDVLGIASVYQADIIKFIFGALLATPAALLLGYRFSTDLESYIYHKQKKRRKALLWISITWFYMTILRMLVQPLLPPLFLVFMAVTLISVVCYARLIK